MSILDAVSLAMPAVVSICSERGLFSRSEGSGFIISEKGHVLTNYHVIEGTKKLTVYVKV